MSDVLEPCVGHFHIVLDIIMLTIILKTNVLILNIVQMSRMGMNILDFSLFKHVQRLWGFGII